MAEYGCRIENRGAREPLTHAGTTVMDLHIVHCPRHSEAHVQALEAALKKYRDALEEYGEHSQDCILSRWEAGEPTPDGQYRWKYAGKWYFEMPKCECGLATLLSAGGTG